MASCTPDRYESRHYISECDCDFALRLTAGGLLRLVQEVSTRHCTLLGVTPERYEATHTAFLLAKLCARVHLDIPAGEEVTVVTTPSAPVRAVYHRYTAIMLGEDKLAAEVDARWVLVDTQTRRILRKAPPELGLPFGASSVPELEVSIPKPQGKPVLVGREKALYSRCDQNRHLNNTRYADILCDYLPPERFFQGSVRELRISYHREVPMGGTLELFSCPAGEETYFLGRGEEGDCFEASLRF